LVKNSTDGWALKMVSCAPTRFYLCVVPIVFAIFYVAHIGLPFLPNYPDTAEYLYLREHAAEGFAAWRHALLVRPILTGLFLLVAWHPLGVPAGQALISFGAWLFLAHSAAAMLSHRLWSRVVFVMLLCGAIGRHTLYFNVAPVSESLSLSMSCLLAATLLRWSRGRGGVVTAVIAATLLVLSRDVWIYAVLIVAAALITLPGLRIVRGSFVLALCMTLVAACGLWTAAKGERHLIPLKQAITHFVIDDDQARAFFAQRGFAMAEDQQRKCLHQPYRFCPFDATQEAWLRAQGKPVYEAWLLQTLPQRVWGLVTAVPQLLSEDLIGALWSKRNAVYDTVSRWLPLGQVHWWYLLLLQLVQLSLLLVLGRGGITLSASQRSLGQVGLALSVAGAGSLFVAYWGDGIEAARHVLLPAALVVLGSWLVLSALIDAVLAGSARWRKRIA